MADDQPQADVVLVERAQVPVTAIPPPIEQVALELLQAVIDDVRR